MGISFVHYQNWKEGKKKKKNDSKLQHKKAKKL
jgi:hypothetical protein